MLPEKSVIICISPFPVIPLDLCFRSTSCYIVLLYFSIPNLTLPSQIFPIGCPFLLHWIFKITIHLKLCSNFLYCFCDSFMYSFIPLSIRIHSYRFCFKRRWDFITGRTTFFHRKFLPCSIGPSHSLFINLRVLPPSIFCASLPAFGLLSVVCRLRLKSSSMSIWPAKRFTCTGQRWRLSLFGRE